MLIGIRVSQYYTVLCGPSRGNGILNQGHWMLRWLLDGPYGFVRLVMDGLSRRHSENNPETSTISHIPAKLLNNQMLSLLSLCATLYRGLSLGHAVHDSGARPAVPL